MRGLIALDLDGTLVGDDCLLQPGHERAVADMQRLGFAVAIATGRMMQTSLWIWEQLRLRTPVVCFNGGYVGLPGQPAIAARTHDEATVRRILDALADYDGSASCYPDGETWRMDHVCHRTRGWDALYRTAIHVAPLRPWQGPSHKVLFVTDPERLPFIVDDLRRRLGPSCVVVASQADRFEVLPPGVTKAWGLAHLAAHLGVPRERVWAVGDNHNDLEMVAWAGHGCAMGQAGHQLRGAARHVLPGVSARGLCALVPLLERAPQ